jgi:hypothetical protein
MTLTSDDRKFLIKLATLMLSSIAWMIASGANSQNLWDERYPIRLSWKENTDELMKEKM